MDDFLSAIIGDTLAVLLVVGLAALLRLWTREQSQEWSHGCHLEVRDTLWERLLREEMMAEEWACQCDPSLISTFKAT
jgi:hypothetical protein